MEQRHLLSSHGKKNLTPMDEPRRGRRPRARGGSHDGGGHERWLVSYADFITLLFAFFVLMYAIAIQDKKKALDMAEALRKSLVEQGLVPPGGANSASTSSPTDSSGSAEGQSERSPEPSKQNPSGGTTAQTPNSSLDPSPWGEFAPTVELLSGALQGASVALPQGPGLPPPVDFVMDHRGLVVRLSATAFFNSGAASVLPEALPLLDQIADVLKKSTREIRVEGHTDTLPLNSEVYATNWELSSARAVWVVRYLIGRHGFAPERLSAAGYGSHRPLTPGQRPQDHALNRRVEIVVVGSRAP